MLVRRSSPFLIVGAGNLKFQSDGDEWGGIQSVYKSSCTCFQLIQTRLVASNTSSLIFPSSSTMSIFSAVLIFSLTAIAATKSANGIQCWVSNEGTVSPRVVSNQLGCLSLFQTEDRVASFGGVPSTPRTAHRQAELAMADGSCKKIEVS